MQLTKWVHGPTWISKVKVIHWPWSKATQIQHFQTSFPEKPLCRLKPNFKWSLNGIGERNVFKWSRSHDQDGRHAHMWLKHEKIFFSGTKRLMTMKVCMHHQVLKYYQIYSNDDPVLTLTYFTTRSNLVLYAFVWEKVKTVSKVSIRSTSTTECQIQSE